MSYYFSLGWDLTLRNEIKFNGYMNAIRTFVWHGDD